MSLVQQRALHVQHIEKEGIVSASSMKLARKEDRDMKLVMLDEKEVANRGSHCLDGSTPGYYFEEGSEAGKFLFWLHGGGYCTSESDCASYLPIHDLGDSVDALPILKHDAFSSYNHVYILNCDLGIYMGDRSEPVTYNGNTLYFQGARILRHVVDTIQSSYSLTEDLVSGGSGGGHSLYAVADYLKGLLPTSVTKFGVAPINGWYISDHSELASMFTLQNMGNVISPKCKDAFSSAEQYKCLDPATSYRYTESKMFMTQILDYTFEWNVTDSVKSAYNNCLSTEDPSGQQCTEEDVDLLQSYLTNYTTTLKSYPRYYENGEGGYFSTCTKHTFYDDDDLFASYANNGVTVGDAISRWWAAIGTNSPAQWYLPCTLGSAGKAQCEETCSSSQ